MRQLSIIANNEKSEKPYDFPPTWLILIQLPIRTVLISHYRMYRRYGLDWLNFRIVTTRIYRVFPSHLFYKHILDGHLIARYKIGFVTAAVRADFCMFYRFVSIFAIGTVRNAL